MRTLRTERAPSAEELFSNGNHAGTQAYELGNPGFRLEKSWGVEGTFHAHAGRFSLDASVFYNRFDDFIYEARVEQAVCDAASAEGEAELPCFQYQQRDARYYGFEVDASARLFEAGGFRFVADGVRAMVVPGSGLVREQAEAGRIVGERVGERGQVLMHAGAGHLVDDASWSAAEAALAALAEYTVRHFASEERLLARHHYPGQAAHAAGHRKIEQQLQALRAEMQHHRENRVPLKLNLVATLWLFEHIIDDDAEFAHYMREAHLV